MELGTRIPLEGFVAALSGTALEVPKEVRARLAEARAAVDEAAAGDAPVYGLNTGLGANLDHRIAAQDIAGFQAQLIAGRAVAVGPLMAPRVGRAVLLARLIGAAKGHSGMSVPMFDHLVALWRAGLAPGVPTYGSIGAADLTQNACWARGALGQGWLWDGAAWIKGDLDGLTAPTLQPKDAMALINHGGTSAALAGLALSAAAGALQMARHAAVLSFEGYAANPRIFDPEINALRPAPGQAEMAAWFAASLDPATKPRRVQDALSFRTLAPVMGAAQDALARAIAIWEDEINGASDNPALLGSQPMCSTPNFHAPALALALEQVSLALAMVAQGAVMRIQRLMDPDLSGLPRYLSPVGGASAGLVPLQKTAAALLGDIRRHAHPIAFDPAPVSDGVEDMAPMTPRVAQKLHDQMMPLRLLVSIEALVAAQARDLRGCAATPMHAALRADVAMLEEDRALGEDATTALAVLERHVGVHPLDDL